MTLRRARARLAIAVAAAALGCASPHAAIPSGTYTSRSGEDHVRVEGERMWFFVKVDERPRSEVGSVPYGYRLLEEERVQVILTSGESVHGLGSYRYEWNGRELTMRHRTSGQVLVFVREAAPGY